MKTDIIDGLPHVEPEELNRNKDQVKIVDVRRPEEWSGELGTIEGAELVTLGPDLQEYLEKVKEEDPALVFVCRSGGRSGQATAYSRQIGMTKTVNMSGGMLLWNEKGLPRKN